MYTYINRTMSGSYTDFLFKLNENHEQSTTWSKYMEVANQELWIDKDLRNSLLNMALPGLLSDGETPTKLWTSGTPPQFIEVPISWAMDKLPYVEIYAKRTYDLRANNEVAVYVATTIEEVIAIDVKASFSLFLTFELNLENYETESI